MKKHKFLIYIALFFGIFMLGTTKVKATDYLECKYKIPKSDIPYDWADSDFKLYIEFKSAKVNRIATNKVTSTSGSWKNHLCNYDGEPKECSDVDYEQYFEIGSFEEYGYLKCPPVKAKKVYATENWYDLKKEMDLTYEYYFYNRNAHDCVYVSSIDGSKKTITVNYDEDFGNTVTKIAHTDAYGPAVYIPGFFETLRGLCPSFYHEGKPNSIYSGTNYFSNDGMVGTGSYIEYEYEYMGCTIKDGYNYNSIINYLNGIDISKIESEGMETDSKKYLTYKSSLSDWEELLNYNNNVDDCREEIQNYEDKFADIAKKYHEVGIISDEAYETIKDKLKSTGSTLNSSTLSWNVNFGEEEEPYTCEQIFTNDVLNFLKDIFTWVRIGVPILLIILGMIDFSQVVISQDADAMKKSTSKFMKRCIVAIAIFLLPSLIMLILTWINDYVMSTDPECVIKNLNIVIRNILK